MRDDMFRLVEASCNTPSEALLSIRVWEESWASCIMPPFVFTERTRLVRLRQFRCGVTDYHCVMGTGMPAV